MCLLVHSLPTQSLVPGALASMLRAHKEQGITHTHKEQDFLAMASILWNAFPFEIWSPLPYIPSEKSVKAWLFSQLFFQGGDGCSEDM